MKAVRPHLVLYRLYLLFAGATNRIEAIDPALRRSDRFDREFFFPLPSAQVLF